MKIKERAEEKILKVWIWIARVSISVLPRISGIFV